MNIGLGLAVAGAAITAFLGAVGSAWGIAIASEAAGGVLTEDPEKFGRVLVLLALPGTQGFYAFLGMFYVMLKINLLKGGMPIDLSTGLQLCFAALPVGVVGLFSAYYQGRASAAGILLLAKRPEEMGKAVILPAMVETYAVVGLLATILLVSGIKV
ncbi:permease [candidate division WOR-1 bacterium RIFOXYD2_FULL_36_8]|uniref:Permease n=1 Tax=candidate division WOR-1 bacterium RIFOXYB2_FULL_36_35 TaxID=1802578 RepID=A0A1F4RZY0_UNCSA|nr:MAG: permease [candidate division WOR-1 bacterium RIFOXYA2_FULL_36_21]OGC13746.1 MAG: permease [candidate division WOR-1 bacterium RIFOXYB2_FULL_36_35]OGC14469.1 MAG: permease [candidate division WOR-1 bacterium RIFOXYA12_FULL_36_13]OGC41334.1 MAG: permease [candidate division WOR-1 bacterium RIFOXYD2_FULL_36_8]